MNDTTTQKNAAAPKSDNEIRFLQVNVGRRHQAMAYLRKHVSDKRIDLSLIQEPTVRKANIVGLPITSTSASGRSDSINPCIRTAIFNSSNRVQIQFLSYLSNQDCTVVKLSNLSKDIFIVSAYLPPNSRSAPSQWESAFLHLQSVMDQLRHRSLIIGMDANAKSALWGNPFTDVKGNKVQEWIIQNNMIVANCSDSIATYYEPSIGQSWIDLTIVSADLADMVESWEVSEEHNFSDHRYITWIVKFSDSIQKISRPFNIKKADWSRYEMLIRESLTPKMIEAFREKADPELLATLMTEGIQQIAEACIPRLGTKRVAVPWWTEEIEDLRHQTRRARRRFQRERSQSRRAELKLIYNRLKNEYGNLMMAEKKASWERFCTEATEMNPWSIWYRIMSGKLRKKHPLVSLKRADGTFTESHEETARQFLNDFFSDETNSVEGVCFSECENY